MLGERRWGRLLLGLTAGVAVGVLAVICAGQAVRRVRQSDWGGRLAATRGALRGAGPLLFELGLLALEWERPLLGRLARAIVGLAARQGREGRR